MKTKGRAVAEVVKFTFRSLLQDEPPAAPEAKIQMVPEAEIETARAAAFQNGLLKGRAEAEQAVERSLTLLLEEVAAGTARMLRELEGEIRATRVEAAGLALAVARKLSGRLLAQAPLTEIEAMLADALAEHPDEPRIVVRLDENLLDALRRRLDPLLARNGFAGRVILIGEPGFEGADCRIEWPDGGTERRAAVIAGAVESVFSRFAALSDGPAYAEMSEV